MGMLKKPRWPGKHPSLTFSSKNGHKDTILPTKIVDVYLPVIQHSDIWYLSLFQEIYPSNLLHRKKCSGDNALLNETTLAMERSSDSDVGGFPWNDHNSNQYRQHPLLLRTWSDWFSLKEEVIYYIYMIIYIYFFLESFYWQISTVEKSCMS